MSEARTWMRAFPLGAARRRPMFHVEPPSRIERIVGPRVGRRLACRGARRGVAVNRDPAWRGSGTAASGNSEERASTFQVEPAQHVVVKPRGLLRRRRTPTSSADGKSIDPVVSWPNEVPSSRAADFGHHSLRTGTL